MKARVALWLISAAAVALGAVYIKAPGYMDADYYMANGQVLAAGLGWQEPFLWNYLNDPQGLPQPSHQYWMPLASLLAALGMRLFGLHFRAGQMVFLLLASLVPVAVHALARSMGLDRQAALLAGGLAVASGFFYPFMLTSDTFALYALLGALWMLALQRARRGALGLWLAVGAISGLAHLSRADGALILVASAAFVALQWRCSWRALLALVAGYGLVLAPWWARTWVHLGALFPAGAARALWLLRYDELFTYPAAALTPDRWLGAGLEHLLQARLTALGWNLLSLLATNGLVFLAPLMVWGAWRQRKQPLVRLGAVYLALLMVVMSFVFPFAGRRGGFFHSSAALMPLLWSLAPVGLKAFVQWGARQRGWRALLAWRTFAGGALALAVLTTALLYQRRVVGPDPRQPRWSASARAYRQVGEWLAEQGAVGQRVAVNNPPGFYLATGMPAVVLPSGGLEALAAVVGDFQVAWVVLDANNPDLQPLYQGSVQVPWLQWAGTLPDEERGPVVVYRVVDEGQP